MIVIMTLWMISSVMTAVLLKKIADYSACYLHDELGNMARCCGLSVKFDYLIKLTVLITSVQLYVELIFRLLLQTRKYFCIYHIHFMNLAQ